MGGLAILVLSLAAAGPAQGPASDAPRPTTLAPGPSVHPSEATAPAPAPVPGAAPMLGADDATAEPATPDDPTPDDPWASVPVQSVVRQAPVQTVARPPSPEVAAADALLLDPWARPLRDPASRSIDADLRNPFAHATPTSGQPLARAELRDPFADRGAPGSTPAMHGPTLPRQELRDPFHRRPASPSGCDPAGSARRSTPARCPSAPGSAARPEASPPS